MRKWIGAVVILTALVLGGCGRPAQAPVGTGEPKATGENGPVGTPMRILVLEATEGVISVDNAPVVPQADIEFKEIGMHLTTDSQGYAVGTAPVGEYTLIVTKYGFEQSVVEKGKVSAGDWPNVLWISRSKQIHMNGKKN